MNNRVSNWLREISCMRLNAPEVVAPVVVMFGQPFEANGPRAGQDSSQGTPSCCAAEAGTLSRNNCSTTSGEVFVGHYRFVDTGALLGLQSALRLLFAQHCRAPLRN